MSYVGWPTKVKKTVLDSAQFTVGEGATIESNLEVGKKRSRLSVSNAPKKFSVTMRFNYSEKDEKGLSEKDRFWSWYENVLKYSVNEFQFPDLMYGVDSEKLCWYRITGAVQGAKSGLDQEIQMTWESSYEGVITAEETPVHIERLGVEDGCAVFYFSGVPSIEPTTNSFGALEIDQVVHPLTGIKYFGNDRVYLYFDKIRDGQYHTAKFSGAPDFQDTFLAETAA